MQLCLHQERYILKSFTRNQANIQGLKSDKRFDVLVKQQTIEHEHALSCHNKEMQALRENLRLSMERFESLFQLNQGELKDFRTHIVGTLGVLKERTIVHDKLIDGHQKTIADLHNQILGFNSVYSSKMDVEKVKIHIENKIKDSANIHMDYFQNLQREVKILFKSLKDDLIKMKDAMEEKFVKLTDKTESNFSLSRLDKEGVLKAIRVYEKTIFIIEKKIENIYTLIERINKKGEIYHTEKSNL
jgi:hypothetical protein